MATGTKTFQTQFKIGAVWTGQPAVAQAQRALGGVHQTAQKAHGSFLKMAAAAGAAFAALEIGRRVLSGLNTAFHASIDAALDVQKAHENLRNSVERNWSRWEHGAKTIDEVTQSLVGLAEANEKTGFDAENAEAGLSKLQDSMAPERIKLFSQTFFDITAKLKGANASGEDFAEVAQLINSAVNQGRPGLLRQVGLTREQIKAFATLKTVEERRAYIAKFVGQKVAGEQARVFKTTAGKIAQMQTQLGNLAESFGKPLIEPMGALADAFREVFIAMGPVADEFADKLGPEVHKFSQWLIDNKAAIIEWAKWAADWVLWLGQKFVVSLQDTYAQWQPVWANLKHDWEYLSTSWNMIVENIKSGAAAAWTGVTEIWNQAREYFTKLIEDIKKLFEPLYESIIKPFKDAYDYLIKLWPNLGGSAAGGAGGGAAATAPVAASSGARQAEDYVAPWQQTGPPTAPAAPGTVADLPTTPAVATAVVNEKIAAERARVMKQLQEPGMRELTAAVVAKEQSGVGGKTDVLEALVNRSVVTGKHPRDLIRGGFYGPVNRGEVDALLKRGLSASQLQEYDVASGAVGAGSNRIRGRTDQGMYNEIKGERLKSEGEYYGMMGLKGEKQTEAYKATLQQATQAQAKAPLAPGPLRTDASVPAGSRLKDMIKEMNIQQRVSGATGGQNIAMNAPITVNGVAPGRESLMARQTALALRDPTAQLLTGIKKAQRQESRLGYV